MLTRRFFLAALGSAALPVGQGMAAGLTQSLRPVARGTTAEVAPVAKQAPSVAKLIAEMRFSGDLAFAVCDAQTGEVLEQQEVAGHLPPASVAKSVTALYALHHLGPAYRFRTRVLATAPVVGGVLDGDLVLVGGADPTLDTDGLADLAREVRASGLREVKGQFLVWGDAVLPHTQIDTEQSPEAGYNPAICGLNLNYNRVHFEWRKAGAKYDITMDARSEKYRPDVHIATMKIVSRDVPVFTYANSAANDDWTVAQGALGNSGARWLPVRKPALYAGEVFAGFMRANGIALKAPVITRTEPNGAVLGQHRSEALSDVLRGMLKYSTNLTAEIMGLAASERRLGAKVSMRVSAAEMSFWAADQLGLEGALFVDHSGLGGDSRVPAVGLAKALSGPPREGLLPDLLKAIPIKKIDGAPDKAHPVKVVAKTGTLNFVSGLAGYATTSKGRQLSFAIFSGDLDRRDALGPDERDRPPGGRTWNTRAKQLQQALILRWDTLYDA